MDIDEEDEIIDVHEQMFHNSVREQIVSKNLCEKFGRESVLYVFRSIK